jgi:hypothetical protein
MIIKIGVTDYEMPKVYKYWQQLRLDLKSEDEDYFYGIPIELKDRGLTPYPKYAWKKLED